MKQIIINLEDERGISIEMNEGMKVTEVLTMLFNAQLASMNRFMEVAKDGGETEEDLKNIKEDLWHMYNQAASNVLETFIPDKELRPDLTAQALLELENSLIDKLHEEVTANAGKGL